MLTVIDKL
ncbi:uncharacterized protein FFB14_15837 [Fusarium fujikuroi]|nr:uncharacterized protein FFB14_15837 [Fusarium fujikuroi]